MTPKQFEKDKIYYTWTRKGEIRLFKVTRVLGSKKTGKRLFVEASFNGKPVERYEIRTYKDGDEYVIADNRYSTLITADEYKGAKI